MTPATPGRGAPPDVTLRNVQDADLDAFFLQQQDEDARFLAAFVAPDPQDRAAFEGHWRRLRADPRVTTRTVLVAGEVAGHLGAFDRDGEREVTYWIDRSCWGRGVATAALRQFLALEARRPIHARVVEDNVGSRRVLEKCGFVAYGEERDFANGRGAEVVEVLLRLDDPPLDEGPAR